MNIRTIYNTIDIQNIMPSYDCDLCFIQYRKLVEYILTFFNRIHIGLLNGAIVNLSHQFSFYLTRPLKYEIIGSNSQTYILQSITAQRLDILEYDFERVPDSVIRGVRLWLACHMTNIRVLQTLNGQVGNQQPIIVSAEWLPVLNIQDIENASPENTIDIIIPRHGLFAFRLHKIKSKNPLVIMDNAYLYHNPKILYIS
jgi:hypothetical protein